MKLLLLVILFLVRAGLAQTLSWDFNAPEDSVQTYKIYYGHAPGDRQFVLEAGNTTSYAFAPKFTTNTYFVVTAVNGAGESGPSNEAAFIVDSVAVNICDCDGDGAAKYTLDFAKLRRLQGQNKFLASGAPNPKYKESYDLNQDEKISGLDAAIHRQKCK